MKKCIAFLLLMFFYLFNAFAQQNQDRNIDDVSLLSGYDFRTKILSASVDASIAFNIFRFDLEYGALIKTDLVKPEVCMSLSPMFGCMFYVFGKLGTYTQAGYQTLLPLFTAKTVGKETAVKLRARTGIFCYLGQHVLLNFNASYATSFMKNSDFWPDENMLFATVGLGYVF